MSIKGNIDQFRHSFQEEARELVADLEAALLLLNENRDDEDLVGRVFRALHTIKGSGSMFGFDKLASFTHNLENAFDEVRNGRFKINSELIDLTLAALDQIRAMIEDGSGGPEVDDAVCNQILNRVRQITSSKDAQAAESASGKTITTEQAPTGEAQQQVNEWSIRFAPGPEMMQFGADPLLLIRELRQMGTLTVKASMAEIPPLAELEPERCYVSWEMILATTSPRDAISDIFIFVADSCELDIQPIVKLEAEKEVCAGDLIAKGLEDKRASNGGRRNYDKADSVTSLRVPAAKLDQFVDLVGELVTVQARLSEIATRRDDPEFSAVAEEIERLTSSLRENSMNIRMLPIRGTFEKFRRLVHDLARDLGKDVELTMEGVDTELDKTVIDQLSDPLMHLIRNSMDHGIESASKRTERGKRPTAIIHLAARHSGASVLIEVSDDGGGIDVEAVRNRGIERGLITADMHLSESQTFDLIFQPGFSTAKTVTDVSGRGVGMDVVRQSVESLRGTIEVASKPGIGTSVTLRLPLTLAIIDGLLVSVGDACFVLPLANTLECIELSEADIEHANGKHVANVRGEIVPYIRLRQYFNVCTERPPIEQIMIVETDEGRFGFVVDQVLGNCQTVIKSLGRFYKHVQIVSGATILGNGTVALILDPYRLVQEALKNASLSTRLPGLLAGAREAVANAGTKRSSAVRR